MTSDLTLIADLVRAGVDPDLIGRVAAAMAGTPVPAVAAPTKAELSKAAKSARNARYYRNKGGPIPADMRRAVYERDGFQCVYCGVGDDLTCDHIVPVSKGGPTDMDNLATACRPCNSRKKDRDRKFFLRNSDGHSADIPQDIERTETGQSSESPRNVHGMSVPSRVEPLSSKVEANEKKESKRGYRLPKDWLPSEASWGMAIGGLGEARATIEREKFRDHFAAKPGAAGLGLDWDASWRNWVRKAVDWLPQPRAGPNGHHAKPLRTNSFIQAALESQEDADRARDFDNRFPHE